MNEKVRAPFFAAIASRLPLLPRSEQEWLRLGLLVVALSALVPPLLIEYKWSEKEWTREVEIPFPTRIRKTYLMQKGWEVILREGSPGVKRVKLRAGYRGSRVVWARELESKVLRQPRRETRLVGLSGRANSINAPKLTRVVRSLKVLATAYDPGPESNSFEHAGITSLGWRTRHGIIAVDPKVIPLRSLVFVEGYGLAWAGDVGGAIKGKRVDLCFNTTSEALKWGKRNAWIYVLQGAKGPRR